MCLICHAQDLSAAKQTTSQSKARADIIKLQMSAERARGFGPSTD